MISGYLSATIKMKNQNACCDEIYDKIRTINIRLEVVLDFLKECIEINSISKNTDRLIEEGINIECINKKNINDLSGVRDRLLEQCQFNNQSL